MSLPPKRQVHWAYITSSFSVDIFQGTVAKSHFYPLLLIFLTRQIEDMFHGNWYQNNKPHWHLMEVWFVKGIF